jgi:RNA polymerase sigma-70 factor, ECF subfamily
MLAQAPLPRSPDSNVVPLRASDDAIVQGLIGGEPWAANALYERYAPAIERILRRTLGNERHTELADLLHDVFVEAIRSAPKLRDTVALLAWLQKIAVHTAYRTMRRRRARSWLWFSQPEDLPEIVHDDPAPEVRQACAAFYRCVGHLPARQELLFSLRYVEGMEVAQIALVTGTSLSTVKRQLALAEARFTKLAERDPALSSYLAEGTRWTR